MQTDQRCYLSFAHLFCASRAPGNSNERLTAGQPQNRQRSPVIAITDQIEQTLSVQGPPRQPGALPRARPPWSNVRLIKGITPWFSLLVVLALHLSLEGGVDWRQRLIGSVSGMAMALFGSLYLTRSKFHRLPILEFGLIQIYVFWGLPTLFADMTYRFPVATRGITSGLMAVALFTLVLLIFYPFGKWLGDRAKPVFSKFYPGEMGTGMNLIYWPWLALTLFGNTGLAVRLPAAMRHPVVSLSSYFPLLGYTALLSQRDKGRAWLFPLATVLLALSGMISGRMRYVLLPILIAGVIFLVSKRRFPWRMTGLIFLLFVILQPAKLAYRSVAWGPGEYRQSFDVELTASHWYEAIMSTWASDEDVEDNQQSITTRLNLLAPIAIVFEMVPGIIPHVGTSHWKLLLVSPIPRAIYPDKPNFTEAINNHYSLVFGIQDEKHVGSSTAAFPLVSDGYWCFGWPGVVFVAMVVGLMLGFNTRCFDLRNWTGLSFSLLMFAEMRPTSNLVGLLGGQFQRVTGLLLICWGVWFFSLGFMRKAGKLRRPGPSSVMPKKT